MPKLTYKVAKGRHLTHDNKPYHEDATVTLDDAHGDPLVALGVLELVEAEKPKRAAKADEAEA